MKKLLDHGYLKLIESWGSDERIIESARMSTNKGFLGWGPKHDEKCDKNNDNWDHFTECTCGGEKPGDEKLLRHLYTHKHFTPFEFAGMTLEVQAPIFVFREWHRHRTQSYNEMSARYTPLPDLNYIPTRERIVEGVRSSGKNKQAQGLGDLDPEGMEHWLSLLENTYTQLELAYKAGLARGIPKELARILLPVGRYSRMRASANLRNWLQFLTLRCEESAQWEIRQYADAAAEQVKLRFPRTYELYVEGLQK